MNRHPSADVAIKSVIDQLSEERLIQVRNSAQVSGSLGKNLIQRFDKLKGAGSEQADDNQTWFAPEIDLFAPWPPVKLGSLPKKLP